MTKNQRIIWRLKEQPTAEALQKLVGAGVLKPEEAREILFSLEDVEDRDKKSLEAEIMFLRELVEKLANRNETRIVEVIREVEKPWKRWDWYTPYVTWCRSNSLDANDLSTTESSKISGGSGFMTVNIGGEFSQIKTF